MKRQIVADTETTGLDASSGDRIVEIGLVELIDGKKTGKVFHKYINPQREIPENVIAVHGITNEMVKDAPKFGEIADEMIEFIKGSEIIIHNVKFDSKFIDKELEMVGKGALWDYIKNATCTWELSKRLYSKERKHKLDNLCDRFEIDRGHRTLHGALLDADLLADVYIEITKKHKLDEIESDVEQKNWVRPEIKKFNGLKFKKVELSKQEIEDHNAYLAELEKKEKVVPVFSSSSGSKLKP